MDSNSLALSCAVTDNERTRAVIGARVQPQGAALTTTVLDPSEIFWRQLRFAEFDISEMSMSALMILAARGDRRWVGLPVFSSRAFYHVRVLVRDDCGIEQPADLVGKRVGVPEYLQTSALWVRGVLHDEFGVEPASIDWHMERGDDRSLGATLGFKVPQGVRLRAIPQESSIGEMLAAGTLDAAIAYMPHRNLVDRTRVDVNRLDRVRPLFAKPLDECRRYFAKTGFYPINHAVVVRRELIERHPWLALNLYAAFNEACLMAERDAQAILRGQVEAGLIHEQLQTEDRRRLAPYGIASNQPILEAMVGYAFSQGLIDRPLGLDEMFAAPTLAL